MPPGAERGWVGHEDGLEEMDLRQSVLGTAEHMPPAREAAHSPAPTSGGTSVPEGHRDLPCWSGL